MCSLENYVLLCRMNGITGNNHQVLHNVPDGGEIIMIYTAVSRICIKLYYLSALCDML